MGSASRLERGQLAHMLQSHREPGRAVKVRSQGHVIRAHHAKRVVGVGHQIGNPCQGNKGVVDH